MSDSRIESTVTFHHPVMLKDFEAPQAAGTYRLVIDMEELQGLSFTATRRTGVRLYLPDISVPGLPTSVVEMTQRDLDALIANDAKLG